MESAPGDNAGGVSTPNIHLSVHQSATWHSSNNAPRPLERKHAAMLAWLWLEGPTPRSRLAGLLWPEVSEERARGNLRQRLLKLRQDAGDVVADNGTVLSLATGVAVDPPDPPSAPLLQGLEFDDCEGFAAWLDARRETERERRKREWLAEVREAAAAGPDQRLDDALFAAEQLLHVDRESEEAFRVLMQIYYLRGDHAAALGAWDRCRDMLRQVYGVQPSAATRLLGDTILAAARTAQDIQAAWATASITPQELPASVLRPPQLVGREMALSTMHQAFYEGQVICVAGEAGVGKSRLLSDWAATLGPVALASARPGDAVLPYASLSRLLLAAIDRFKPPLQSAHAAQAARVLPRLASLAGLRVEPVRTEYERSQALMALARLLVDCTERGAVAFVLDDLQFADSASLAALRVLAEPQHPPAVPATSASAHRVPPTRQALRFVFARRPEEANADTTALMSSLQSAHIWRQVDLNPLSAADAHALLACLQVPGLRADAWATFIWNQVGGNPAFLLESVKLLLSTVPNVADHIPGAQALLPLPSSIQAVIERRIDLLSPRARHLAQMAAIAGSGYSVQLAAAALACAPIELSEPLRELELRQVFYGRRFVHDVIASVTLAAVPAAVPAAVAEFMHRFVAEHLQQHQADPAQVATHWGACGEWRFAGRAFADAARAAGAAALANEQAALLDRAIAAFDRTPFASEAAARDELFAAIEDRANVFESTGHEGLRPQFIQRLQALAETEAQRLSALNHHNGWLTNLAQPIEEEAILAAIPRAAAVGRPELAWYLARMLGFHWGMNNRADEALALLAKQEPWVESEGSAADQASYRQTRSSIHAFGDRLESAMAEGHLALLAYNSANDWPGALPTMSNLGVMHYWRGEYIAAHELLAQARAQRERLYGNRGSAIKIDIHLGAVLYELGRLDEARAMLENAVVEMMTWHDNDYRRTECLLAHNHLAQMFIATGQAEAAAQVLAVDTTGVADRFYGRRLALRLRWQRVFGRVDPALVAELQAVADRVASPFNRALMSLELARQQPPQSAKTAFETLFHSPPAQQRPGLQLHAAALALRASQTVGDRKAQALWVQQAQVLRVRCGPFDMPLHELQALLA